MDETYQAYINRVMRITLQQSYHTQLQNIQKSPKFQDTEAVDFPGYSVITPPGDEDGANQAFYRDLAEAQRELVGQLPPNLVIPLPTKTFHLTLADLIWDSAYRTKIKENPSFSEQLKSCIRESFRAYEQTKAYKKPNKWQLLGLMVLPRAITVALVPKNEESYQNLLQLRQSIYQNSDLMALGIEQQYYLNAHITLGYFNGIPGELDRENLANQLSEFNNRWLVQEPQFFEIKTGELRHFSNMMTYRREEGDPVVTI